MISTQVIDSSIGQPAVGVRVLLEVKDGTGFKAVSNATTNNEGRIRTLIPPNFDFKEGQYLLSFGLSMYFQQKREVECFNPMAGVMFHVTDPNDHYHIGLIITPFGYSVFRGVQA